jgi:hypothetical protein
MSKYPVGESTHLQQNREISGIRIDYFYPNGAAKAQNIPNILQDIGGGPTGHATTIEILKI